MQYNTNLKIYIYDIIMKFSIALGSIEITFAKGRTPVSTV